MEDIAVYQNKSITDAQTTAKLDSIQSINSKEIVHLRSANHAMSTSIRLCEKDFLKAEELRKNDAKRYKLSIGMLSFGLLTTTILYIVK